MEKNTGLIGGETMKHNFGEGCPEGVKGVTKVIGFNQGFRGKVIAINERRKQAIWIAQNGDIWGKIYLVEEDNPNEWMKIVKQVDWIPNTNEWKII